MRYREWPFILQAKIKLNIYVIEIVNVLKDTEVSINRGKPKVSINKVGVFPWFMKNK